MFNVKKSCFCPILFKLGKTLHRSKPYTILSKRFQTTLNRKNLVRCCLWGTLQRKSPSLYNFVPRLQTIFHCKKSRQCRLNNIWSNDIFYIRSFTIHVKKYDEFILLLLVGHCLNQLFDNVK